MVDAYFIDSSALVKQYVPEIGSAWIQQIVSANSGNLIIIARITWVEVLSALARRQREGSLNTTDVHLIIQRFRFDLNTHYQVVELDQVLTESAGQLINQYPLRAYDAIQLASALRIQPIFAPSTATSLTFLSADNRLLLIAQTAGLLIDNPNNHP
ncbi:MAG: type II toxin-antitoxin system VapC family toxin [Microcoleus sp. SIO2G3]|nr:type II toxin-antitoxin system VapC family toxin [Microcoleus sp. SIO2G3]